MSVYVDENFDEYTAPVYGAVPPGWDVNGPPMQIFSFAGNEGFAAGKGQYTVNPGLPQDNFWWGSASLTTPSTVGFPSMVTLFLGMRPNLDNQGFGSAQANLLNIDGLTTGVCYFKSEANNSISVYCGDSLILNSQQSGQSGFIFSYNTWYYIQFNVTVTALSSGNVGVSIGLQFNGSTVLTSLTTFDTGIPLSDIHPFGNPGIINFTLESGAGYTSYSRIVLEDWVPANDYPIIRTPNLRATQYPIEVGQLPDSSFTRITQMPIEVARLPSTAKVRVSQMVIELVYQGIPIQGWIVQEA